MITLKDKHGNHKIPVMNSPLFWLGIFLKLGLSVCFASAYLKELFAPFGNYFIASGFSDPYNYFAQNGTGAEFPYPPMMLWVFSSIRALLWPVFPGTMTGFGIADSFLYRLPLLGADLVILLVLLRWIKDKPNQVLIWYWLSPVLIYINYFHGQLDVIPMAMLVISLYFLFKSQWIWSFVFLGFAITCKTNIVLVIPFYLIYLFKTSEIDLMNSIKAGLAFVLCVLLINLPYIGSPGFISMVYNNPVQRHVFDLYYQFNETLRIYFIPSVFFILVLWYSSFRFVNRDQLILFLTFTFLALTLMIAPMQGWYYWIMPFLTVFIIRQGNREKQIFLLLILFYFVYFGMIPESDYTNSFLLSDTAKQTASLSGHGTSGNLLSIVFTLLQTTLLLTGLFVYKKGISSNIQAKFLSQPYLIGIGGDSAAGKSTLTNALVAVFEPRNSTVIRGDDMHKWERGNENWKTYTHLDPRANKLHEDLNQAISLKTGTGVKRRSYDHSTGKFTLPKFLKPNKLIIFEGLHSFYLKNQADVYDLKVFMEPAEDLRIWWKMKRDVDNRGYSAEKVIEQLKKREEDSLKYIRSQSAYADVIATFFSTTAFDPYNTSEEPRLALKISFPDNISMDALLEQLETIQTLTISHTYKDQKQEVVMEGSISGNDIDFMAYRLIPELEDVGIYNAEWKDNYEGLLQLFVVYIVFSKLKAVIPG